MSEEKDDDVISEEVLYEKIDHYLLTFGTDRSLMCVSELDGFLTALGCSVQELEPDVWLNAIWGADEDQPVWESTEQEDEFLSLVLIMYMETMNSLLFGDFYPVYLEQEVDGEYTLLVEEWCVGFIRGAKLIGLGIGGDREFFDEVLAPVRLFGTEAGWDKLETMVTAEVTFWRETLEPSILRLVQHYHPEMQTGTKNKETRVLH
ncbi:MAG: UPF0149 family protein [Gammaproteobacteria bacterium]|uniref:YecA family protein n=1 Tax=Marinomonas polaris DSM 16579 TaxID=1122206 RepID=A0A1M5IR41_9GAMM|nr:MULTISPECIES: UPF0149 family protein [Marinomonas]MBU1296633.1 UPF0149 family protein [Gammaproteobacteria bacterium]MBU1467901.1 UPF0149 family protein [Gammaproteobacteria bacterium]MBU2238109.1 UPF0149 family protein [Gammaproteobacteria bacterium]MBU2318208.1 UPF0149 family protein [Gammaproteobacteria bacterium]MBU2412641.1 UPF0149 family protein [Gammaproteobacteria bacterium]|tara:strand:+ start:11243 stop:11857 length:615 start_codon:yes stop_codon:yes gene_type:complete